MSDKRLPRLGCVLDWHDAAEDPTVEGDYLLYNPCDGYHVAEVLFDEDGKYCGFQFFGTGNTVHRDFFKAWALLTDTNDLYSTFVNRGA